ncbi:hypothetical protein PBY51_016712 [Eleginops maclovinus]|uniref:Uncharacterized protein n=1 Tax=Eleginops maclovinus TaxID=56733 RepID=A0AAN7WQM7_ELEMC|nr:hypothetical protein PBY51_016712 [Eleginops maclovinus]
MRQDTAVCLSVSSSSPPPPPPLPLPLPHLTDEKKKLLDFGCVSLILQKLNEEEEKDDLVRLVVLSRSSGASLSSSAALETTSGRWGARRCTDYLY